MLPRRREEQGMDSGQRRTRGIPPVCPAPGIIPTEVRHGGSSGKLDRDRSRVMQLKTDLQHREEALRQ